MGIKSLFSKFGKKVVKKDVKIQYTVDKMATVASSVRIGDGTVVKFGAEVDDEVVLGCNVKVEPYVRIGWGTKVDDGVVIKWGTRIGSNCHIKSGSFIGAMSSIGNGAVVKERCELDPGIVIDECVVMPGLYRFARGHVYSSPFATKVEGRPVVQCAKGKLKIGYLVETYDWWRSDLRSIFEDCEISEKALTTLASMVDWLADCDPYEKRE